MLRKTYSRTCCRSFPQRDRAGSHRRFGAWTRGGGLDCGGSIIITTGHGFGIGFIGGGYGGRRMLRATPRAHPVRLPLRIVNICGY